ncbi:bifunctional 2-C-methyl-D-erythritol 4-phosphate cytidylyltransferase/2-C-methyl-D-erythritol 2,4-cyclodiphosphate synthase [Microvirga sp. 2MCAF38]|uniref:bifunctional 2-C-methyl-D-erythritol 4-phosphate cytidylyltransferase/2-C-methyl-D-erythritol 2,4-cyclodiphosphate synthase n=1 Tax=Microvirga sp. 2MCAF38 TaxID=3232989 RepID=UPI003F9C2BDA
MTIVALIVAAGRGLRAGDGLPKQYRPLAGRTVLERTLTAFLSHPKIDRVAVVIDGRDEQLYDDSLGQIPGDLKAKLIQAAEGGEARQQSVLNGLEALSSLKPTIVLVHDAARPFVDQALIDRAIEAADRTGAAVPGLAVTDTIKLVGKSGEVVATPDRANLRAVQTPQAFQFAPLLDSHRKALAAESLTFTDDGGLMEWAGFPVHVFEGDPTNVKLTHSNDFAEAERRLKGTPMTYLTKLGTGFDVHVFGDGDHVWLGGIKVPHSRGVVAHSDGDVILHALTDAILGALADGDIGVHFPPSDPQWKGASSDRFLADAVARVRGRGGIVDHLDVTLLCEAPRLGPHREAMRRRIAEIAGIGIGGVSLKATTTEKLGFTGRGEGIAAQAAATIRLPEESAS